MSDLQAAAETLASDRETAPPASPTPGVLRSLMFWACLLVAAGGYGLATLAPSYVRNQQLKAEYVAADAELQRLVAQIDRYERYCRRLTAAGGGGDAVHRDGTVRPVPSPRPSPPQRVGSSRRAEREGEGESGFAFGEAGVPSQQMVVEESLQFHLEAAATTDVGAAVPAPPVSPVLVLFNHSRVARGVVQMFSAVLLLLAFTLCLDAPGEWTVPVPPTRHRARSRHPLAWLGVRYRSAESGGPN